MTTGGSSIPEVQRLLAVLANGRRVGEAGTAFGVGAAAMAETARSVVTVERDPERAAIAADRLAPFSNVELLVGEWESSFRRAARTGCCSMTRGTSSEPRTSKAISSSACSSPGGFLVLDDMTPDRPGPDPIREWVFAHPGLRATQVLTTPKTSALVSARL